MSHGIPLVVFSHLRWDFVFQRPQHLLTRLARTRPVLFIEEPLQRAGDPRWELRQATTNLTVCQPLTAVCEPGFVDSQFVHLTPMVRELVHEYATNDYDCWFYTPMALPLSASLQPRVTIYDCMDELSAFKFAPTQLLSLEKELLAKADVVFTGGPSLYRAKKDRHANCHCFPSSVDAAHFKQATTDLPDHPAQAKIGNPRFGYFGVIDERFDRDLLVAVADAKPAWQFVMVGPVAKINPLDLQQRPNIHYLGQQPYADLPAFLSGWDVAILPFARNESTKYISPTKTLEYMAADKPIVSTPITDVAEPYGHAVGLGDTPEQFIRACERALAENAVAQAKRREKYAAILAKTSWDSTVDAMADLIEQAAHRRSQTRAQSPSPVPPSSPTPPILVIGAGPTGLSAAYHAGDDSLLLEANDRVGGWCRSLTDKGFTFDFAGHIMFSNDEYVHRMYKLLLGENVHWQDREAWIYSKNVYTRYPFQGSLYGLPAEVIKECIVGAIEARFGSLTAKPPTEPLSNGNGHHKANSQRNGALSHNGHPSRMGNRGVSCIGILGTDPKDDALADCCGDGIAESTVPLSERNGKSEPASTDPRNFKEFIYKVWGAGIAKHFAIPYNQKIWAVPLEEMETSWLGGRVPMPDLGEMIEGALSPKPTPMGPNARFGYPLRGGFQALMNGFLPHVGERLRLNTRVRAVSPSQKVVTTTDGEEIPFEQLISTMPLPLLIKAMGHEVPASVRRAVAGLRYTSVRCVNLGIGRENLTEKHWIYYPEDTVFHRIFVQGNASPHCNPPGGFGLTCEITYGPLKPLPCDGDDLIDRCIRDCVRVGLFKAEDPVWAANQVDMPFAYVVYDHARPKNVALIREWLSRQGIHLAGRYSEWEYYNSDHAFLAGKKAAEAAKAALEMSRSEVWALAVGS